MFIKKIIKKLLKLLDGAEDTSNSVDKVLMLSGKAASKINTKLNLTNINDAEFQVYSQWGEDGIIDYIVGMIEREKQIPNIFIELGVENYNESNTRFLLKNRNWTGLVIDGSEENIKYIKQDSIYWRHDLTALARFITSENIDNLIVESGFSGEIGLLSIDLDGNDYYIWSAIKSVNPIIVVCEYNSLFGDQYSLTIPYKNDFIRGNEHFSNLYFGASIKALIEMGAEKGYCFLGSCSSGVNAFFVQQDYFSIFERQFNEYAIYPSKFSESRDTAGQLSFLKGNARIQQIINMKIVQFDGTNTTIGGLSNIYSAEWLRGNKSQYIRSIDRNKS